eukprot:jgi/Chrzof1/8548/Cz03g15080.t1
MEQCVNSAAPQDGVLQTLIDSSDSPSCSTTSHETYVHRTGNREYLESTVMPLLREGLISMVKEAEQNRLQVAAGVGLEDGEYLPPGWRPLSAMRWLSEYLVKQKAAASQEVNQQDEAACHDQQLAATQEQQ